MCNCHSQVPHHIRVQDEQLRRELTEIIKRAPRRYSLAETIASQPSTRPSIRQIFAVQAYKRIREQQPGEQAAIENPKDYVSAYDFIDSCQVEPEPKRKA